MSEVRRRLVAAVKPRSPLFQQFSTFDTNDSGRLDSEEVVAILTRVSTGRALSQQDAECVYLALNGHEVAPAPILRCAEFLFLQRLAFSGKAVGIRDGKWKSAGFNRSSAYGTEKTNRFGEVKPMIPSMISALEDYLMLERATILGGQADADTWTMSKIPDKRTFVLFDPPYRDTTRYPDGDLPRERVVELALKWRAAGATVCVCEAEHPVRVGVQSVSCGEAVCVYCWWVVLADVQEAARTRHTVIEPGCIL